MLAAAHELPKPVQLRDALRILLVLADGQPARYPAAAGRFASRLILEHRMTIGEAQLVIAAIATLNGGQPEAAGEALIVLLERHDEHRAADYLGRWLQARGG